MVVHLPLALRPAPYHGLRGVALNSAGLWLPVSAQDPQVLALRAQVPGVSLGDHPPLRSQCLMGYLPGALSWDAPLWGAPASALSVLSHMMGAPSWGALSHKEVLPPGVLFHIIGAPSWDSAPRISHITGCSLMNGVLFLRVLPHRVLSQINGCYLPGCSHIMGCSFPGALWSTPTVPVPIRSGPLAAMVEGLRVVQPSVLPGAGQASAVCCCWQESLLRS